MTTLQCALETRKCCLRSIRNLYSCPKYRGSMYHAFMPMSSQQLSLPGSVDDYWQ